MEVIRKVAVIGLAIALVLAGSVVLFVLSQKPKKEIYEETRMEIDVIVSLKNLGSAPAFNIPLRLAMPQDKEPVQYIKTLDFSSQPERWSNDSWGNQFVHYTISELEPHREVNFTFSLSIVLKSIDYNIEKEDIGEYSDTLPRYLGESSLINVNDPDIIKLAKEISKTSKNLLDIAWNAYEWIIDNIYYQQIPGEWDARTTLKNKEGGSAELGNLYVALLRANKIPSRRVSGWAAHFDPGDELSLTRFSHGWTEFYLPNYGWIPVDPTWGKEHMFENFAKSDNTHITVTYGAGIHYFWRGPFSEPHGETEIDTDYQLIIKKKLPRICH